MPIRKIKRRNDTNSVKPIGPRRVAINRRVLGNKDAVGTNLPLEQVEVGAVTLTYLKLSEQIKILEREKEAARKILERHIDKNHVKDAKDNKVCKLSYGGQKIELRKTARKTTLYVEDAADIIRGMSKRIQKRLLRMEETIAGPDVVEEMLLNGELKEEQAEEFVIVKTNYAFSAPKIKK